jgi:hypothetical protein
MALTFPAAPTVGQRYPANPGTPGVTQWEWTGSTWEVVISTVSLGSANQTAYNSYVWPSVNGAVNTVISNDGAGALSWVPAMPTGGADDKIFYNNGQIITTNYTIPTGENSMTAGSVTISAGITVVVPPGSRWSIV